MTRNRLSDLLFAQMRRLGDDGLTPEQIAHEAARTAALVSVADRITDTADLQLKAARLFAEHGNNILPMLPQIGRAAAGDPE